MADPIYTGTVGLPLRLILLDDGVPHDPTTASRKHMTITRPDGTKHAKEAPEVRAGTTSVLDGERPCLEYVTVEGDLELDKNYTVQGYIEDELGKWPAAPIRFRVTASGLDLDADGEAD